MVTLKHSKAAKATCADLIESHEQAEDALSQSQILFDSIEKSCIELIDRSGPDVEWLCVSIKTLAEKGYQLCDQTTSAMVKVRHREKQRFSPAPGPQG